MTVQTRPTGNAMVLDLTGSMRSDLATQTFLDAVSTATGAGATQLAINMAGVPEIDSMGIGALARVNATSKKKGYRCRFFALRPAVQRVLQIVRIDTCLEIAKDEASAVAGFLDSELAEGLRQSA